MALGRVAIIGLAVVGVAVPAGWFFLVRPGQESAVRKRGLRDYRCEQPAKVYFGRLPMIRRPASVASSDVYARIPEYVRIRTESVPANTPLYELLMRAASERFSAALARVARAHDHDVVAELGAIQRAGPEVPAVPDRTAEVLAAIDSP